MGLKNALEISEQLLQALKTSPLEETQALSILRDKAIRAIDPTALKSEHADLMDQLKELDEKIEQLAKSRKENIASDLSTTTSKKQTSLKNSSKLKEHYAKLRE